MLNNIKKSGNGAKASISFDYNGKSFRMTAEEMEAAYRCQEYLFRRKDAAVHLTAFILGWAADEAETAEDVREHAKENDDARSDIENFEDTYKVTVEEAFNELDEITENFLDAYDCSCSEDDLWERAIQTTLKARTSL